MNDIQYIVFLKNALGDKLGTKICCPKDKKSKYKVYPLMFFRPIFLPLGKNSHHMVIFETL